MTNFGRCTSCPNALAVTFCDYCGTALCQYCKEEVECGYREAGEVPAWKWRLETVSAEGENGDG